MFARSLFRDMYELALWSPADYPTPPAGNAVPGDVEQKNLLLYLDKKQKEMEEQLMAIDNSVTGTGPLHLYDPPILWCLLIHNIRVLGSSC